MTTGVKLDEGNVAVTPGSELIRSEFEEKVQRLTRLTSAFLQGIDCDLQQLDTKSLRENIWLVKAQRAERADPLAVAECALKEAKSRLEEAKKREAEKKMTFDSVCYQQGEKMFGRAGDRYLRIEGQRLISNAGVNTYEIGKVRASGECRIEMCNCKVEKYLNIKEPNEHLAPLREAEEITKQCYREVKELSQQVEELSSKKVGFEEQEREIDEVVSELQRTQSVVSALLYQAEELKVALAEIKRMS
jgi:hypothetical protein